jgi:carbamate kinase
LRTHGWHIEHGWDVIITHGNGPQVGFILRRSELASHVLHTVPLDSCGADTQGALGYMIQQSLYNEFKRRGINKQAATVVTQVLEEGHFAPGSMYPKIQAIVDFLESGGKEALVTNPENIERALAGETGTRIVP